MSSSSRIETSLAPVESILLSPRFLVLDFDGVSPDIIVIVFEDGADRGRSQREPGSAKHLSDLLLSQHGAENLQPRDEVANEVGELVDGQGSLHEGLGSCLVD